MNAACDEIVNSKQMKQLFEIILAVGNYVNSGTARGQAYGFKLDALKKVARSQNPFEFELLQRSNPFLVQLSDTKSTTSGRISLLHYIAKFIEESHPDLSQWTNELEDVAKATKSNIGPQSVP